MSTTLLPFLYQTRTILCGPRPRSLWLRSLHSSRVLRRDENEIPFDTGEHPINTTTPPARHASGTATRNTITPSERLVFERIFADIQARGLKPSVDKEEPTQSSSGSRSAMLILQHAARDVDQASSTTVASPGLLAGAAKDRNKALLRFPPALRAVAEKTLGIIDTSNATAAVGTTSSGKALAEQDDDQWETPPQSSMRAIEVERKRNPERQRVENLMTAAKTDQELWQVLEDEVFIMPTKLGLGGRSNTDEPDDQPTATTEEAETTLGDIPPKKMSLYTYGPLYPAYLLFGLRRLNTAFKTPSPLALSVLPRIKELGLESYILGVSTPFFNELLDIYWSRQGNLTAMLELLEEMRYCGLYFDHVTSNILDQIDRQTDKMARGKSHGSLGAALMAMPQYEQVVRGRIAHWRDVVDSSIVEREADMGY